MKSNFRLKLTDGTYVEGNFFLVGGYLNNMLKIGAVSTIESYIAYGLQAEYIAHTKEYGNIETIIKLIPKSQIMCIEPFKYQSINRD